MTDEEWDAIVVTSIWIGGRRIYEKVYSRKPENSGIRMFRIRWGSIIRLERTWT